MLGGISVGEWDELMRVNLRGLFLCCEATLPQMKAQKQGKIINVSLATLWMNVFSVPWSTPKYSIDPLS